jgi:Lrp/AsnC family transcriptional regulator
MPGLVPGIHVFADPGKKDVDGRDKPGHDGKESHFFGGGSMVDSIDAKILDILQVDATVPMAEIAERLGLSATPCWRRIKKMEEDGLIARRVALLDRRLLNVPMTIFVTIKPPRHAIDWLNGFRRLVGQIPEIVEAWRLTGETDYLIRIVVPDIDRYDALYQRLITALEFSDFSASIAMEEMKYTTAIPTSYMDL